MVVSCSAYGCTNKREPQGKLQFFGFPLKNEKLLQMWVKAVRRVNFTPTKASKLCSDHFVQSDYLVRPGTYIQRLKPDTVPSVFVFSKKKKLNKTNDTIETEKANKAQNDSKVVHVVDPNQLGMRLLVPTVEEKTTNFVEQVNENEDGTSRLLSNTGKQLETPKQLETTKSTENEIVTPCLQESIALCANNVEVKMCVASCSNKEVQTDMGTMPHIVDELVHKIRVLHRKLNRQNVKLRQLKGLLSTIRSIQNRKESRIAVLVGDYLVTFDNS